MGANTIQPRAARVTRNVPAGLDGMGTGAGAPVGSTPSDTSAAVPMSQFSFAQLPAAAPPATIPGAKLLKKTQEQQLLEQAELQLRQQRLSQMNAQYEQQQKQQLLLSAAALQQHQV